MAGQSTNTNSKPFSSLARIASDMLSKSLAPSTKNFYNSVSQKFSSFASSVGQPWLPSSVPLLVSFIAHQVSSNPSISPSSLATTLSAISYFHKLSNFSDPTSSFLVRKIIQGISKSRPTFDQRVPITIPILSDLVRLAPSYTISHYQAKLASAMFSLMFHAFLRIGEVTSSPHNIQFHQLQVLPSGAALTFLSFKHSQGKPFTLHIPTSSLPTCPIPILLSYLSLRGNTPGPLFCYPDSNPISQSHFRSLLHNGLVISGFPSIHITPHSFRIGGATYAATKGYSSQQIKLMGRWSSSAVDKYIRVSSFSAHY